MSSSDHRQTASTFDQALQAIGQGADAFWFSSRPAEQAEVLSGRLRLAAELLGPMARLSHDETLDLMAQAVRFQSWKQLSAHLAQAQTFVQGPAPAAWLDPLAAAAVLLPAPDDEVALHPGHLQALERLAGTLAMLCDAPLQQMLDNMAARLHGGTCWLDVAQRHPLKARRPLYGFEVHPEGAEGNGPDGAFVTSWACRALIEELDEVWQGYDDFTPADKRRARRWVEAALAAQPGFLEAGLALAWMQRDARHALASGTVARFVRAAEALVPKGFTGAMPWGFIENRFYHRLLWLQMRIGSDTGDLTRATQAARKQLRLNPRDNLGVRLVMPCLQLRQGQLVGARRALANLQGEIGLGASVVRSFVHHATGDMQLFRRELALALFTLPWLRVLLGGGKAGDLASGDEGFRHVRVNLGVLVDFALPAYRAVPGLRTATLTFLAEPAVQVIISKLFPGTVPIPDALYCSTLVGLVVADASGVDLSSDPAHQPLHPGTLAVHLELTDVLLEWRHL